MKRTMPAIRKTALEFSHKEVETCYYDNMGNLLTCERGFSRECVY